jgi:hypothetical protein
MSAEPSSVERPVLQRLLENAFNGLSLVALGGLLSGFLSYCASYGQFSHLDPALMPAFSSADLATNFGILAIPLFNAVVATVFMAPFISDFIIKKRPLEGKSRTVVRFNIILSIISIISFVIYVLGAKDLYLLLFRLGVIVIAIGTAVIVRLHKEGKTLELDWKDSPFVSAHLAILPIVLIAWTLANYGKHETIERMRNLSGSGVYLQREGSAASKVVVLFASPERAVLFDGIRVFMIPSDQYGKLVSKPDLAHFDERSYLQRMFD